MDVKALKNCVLGVPVALDSRRSVAPVRRSWTKRRKWSLGDSFQKATKRPSAEMAGRREGASACVPSEATLTRSVTPVRRSWTKTTSMSSWRPKQPRGQARLAKATKRESAEMETPSWPLTFCWVGKSEATLASVVASRATAPSEVRKNTRPLDTRRLRPLITGAPSAVIGAPSLVSSPPPSRKTRSTVSNTALL